MIVVMQANYENKVSTGPGHLMPIHVIHTLLLFFNPIDPQTRL